MLIVYGIVATFIAWIWVDYYRLIDIYDQSKLKPLIATFLLGGAAVFLVFLLDDLVFSNLPLQLHENAPSDFLYCIVSIGLPEEFAKTSAFLIAYFIFKNEFKEPIDYLAFVCAAALGFSAVENFFYFKKHGASIIEGRSILSTVGHMFDTSLVAYGIIREKYVQTKFNFWRVLTYFLLAILAHAFYDFWLISEDIKPIGWLFTILLFLYTISIFSTILNNALNNSSFFTYKKVIDSEKVSFRLAYYYFAVFVLAFALPLINGEGLKGIKGMSASVYFTGGIVGITIIRLSRFKLIEKKWNAIIFELPFRFDSGKIRVKGEAYNEAYINRYYAEFFKLQPMNTHNSYLQHTRLAFLEKKVFLKNDATFFVIKIYLDASKEKFEYALLKGKDFGTTMSENENPIVALLKLAKIEDLANPNLEMKDFKFREWAIVKSAS